MSLNISHYQGTTFEEMPFEILFNGVPKNLTDAVIHMRLRKEPKGVVFLDLTSVASAGITITNASGGLFKINKQIIDIEPFNYYYDIKITFSDGSVKTWIRDFRFLVTPKIT
jgi:hypothetical protein